MNEQDFRQFLAERPILNLSALSDELRTDRVNLYKIIDGYWKITKAKRGLFMKSPKNMAIPAKQVK